MVRHGSPVLKHLTCPSCGNADPHILKSDPENTGHRIVHCFLCCAQSEQDPGAIDPNTLRVFFYKDLSKFLNPGQKEKIASLTELCEHCANPRPAWLARFCARCIDNCGLPALYAQNPGVAAVEAFRRTQLLRGKPQVDPQPQEDLPGQNIEKVRFVVTERIRRHLADLNNALEDAHACGLTVSLSSTPFGFSSNRFPAKATVSIYEHRKY